MKHSTLNVTLTYTLACTILCLLTACTSAWTLRTAPAAAPQQWPPAPNPPKLTYLRSLTGLARGRGAGTAVRDAVVGSGAADAAGFGLPVAVATGPDGRIAIADMGRRCVHLHVPQPQRYLTLTGTEKAPIVSPVGVAFASDGRLYVADSAGRVLAFGADGAPLFVLDSAAGEKLQRPTGVAFDSRTQRLYVVDTLGHRVHAFEAGGAYAFSFGQRGDGAGAFNFPTHIFYTPRGELYVTDSLNFRIQIFDAQGTLLGGFGHHGDGTGDLALPKGVAVDRDGVVYVVDGLFDNVQLFGRQGEFLLTLGRRGTGEGEFWLPAGAFISDKDELYVCDTYNRRIAVFSITEAYAAGS